MEEQTIEDLNNQNWERIILELINYTVNLYRRWNLGFDRAIKGYNPEEIVMEGIKKVYTNEWKWNPKMELMPFLRINIRGMVFNLAVNKKENKLSTLYDISEYNNIVESTYTIEDELSAKSKIEYFYNKIKGNEIEEKIFKGWIEGLKKREICDQYKIDETTYKNAYKRLKNKLLKLDIEKRLKS